MRKLRLKNLGDGFTFEPPAEQQTQDFGHGREPRGREGTPYDAIPGFRVASVDLQSSVPPAPRVTRPATRLSGPS